MNLTKIIFSLSMYLCFITFVIVIVKQLMLITPPPGSDNKSMDHDTVDSDRVRIRFFKIKKRERKGWQDYLLPLLIILPSLFISAILTYFIYKLYPFEPTVPNFVTIIGSFFGVFIAFHFLRKSLE